MTTHIPLFILLQPDAYIHIAWGALAFITLVVALICWRLRRRWLRLSLLIPLLSAWFVFLWGSYIGFQELEVVRVEFASRDLPPAFDGYKVVQISDIHAGTYVGGREHILRQAVDSINAQHPDIVVFTGDIQNKEPSEILAVQDILRGIKAKDGIFSVLGNHDYTMYTDLKDPIDIGRNQGNTEGFQYDMGWTVLMNDRRRIHRDSASIVIAGMENDGSPESRFPQKGDISSALFRISRNEFVIMLEHDPTCWRRKILPHSHTQLTLSGHTHNGQLSLFGLTPAMFIYKERYGLYRMGERALFVSKGLGGVVPFRFGATGEIVVITLKSIPSQTPNS